MKKVNESVYYVTEAVLPILHVNAETLPEAWETAVLQTWAHGASIKTQYDKSDDPPSKDVALVMTIKNPLAEPKIHRCFPGGIEDLEIYRQEVVNGIHDHWIDPENGKWEYSYSERIFKYSVSIPEKDLKKVAGKNYVKSIKQSDHNDYYDIAVDQLQYVIESLSESPYTRRAQVVLWKPWEDTGIFDPACLQRLFFRIFDDKLVMNVNMRSNDLFKATYMNLYAFMDLQRLVAEKVSENIGLKIHQSQVNHIVDSAHLYGSYFNEIERFVGTTKIRTFDQRTWTSEFAQPIINEAIQKINVAIEKEKETGRKGVW